MDDLFRVPGQGSPCHIDGIPCRSLVSAPIHPMIALEMTDDRFDLDPLFQGFSEPGFLAFRVWRFPFLGNGNPSNTPSPAAVLLLFKGLVESPVSGHILRMLPCVPPDSSDHPTQGMHIGNIVLILYVGKDQAIIILGKGNDGTKLTVGMTLTLLDDGDIRFMQRIDPTPGGFAGENLFRLIDNLLPERDQAIEFLSRFLEPSAVQAVHHPGSLLDHMTGYLFEFFDRLFPAFRVFSEELLDPEKELLSGLAIGAKGLPEGYLLANPLDLSDDLLSNPVQKIGVRRIGDVLGLGGGVYSHPFGLHQPHTRPGLEQYRLYLLHPFGPDPVPKLHQRRGFQNLTSLERVESTEALRALKFPKFGYSSIFCPTFKKIETW